MRNFFLICPKNIYTLTKLRSSEKVNITTKFQFNSILPWMTVWTTVCMCACGEKEKSVNLFFFSALARRLAHVSYVTICIKMLHIGPYRLNIAAVHVTVRRHNSIFELFTFDADKYTNVKYSLSLIGFIRSAENMQQFILNELIESKF